VVNCSGLSCIVLCCALSALFSLSYSTAWHECGTEQRFYFSILRGTWLFYLLQPGVEYNMEYAALRHSDSDSDSELLLFLIVTATPRG
jgi:hypothetical protein